MKRFVGFLILSATALFATPLLADHHHDWRDHHDFHDRDFHHHHHYGGTVIGFGFGYSPFYGPWYYDRPYYYDDYYYAPRVYTAHRYYSLPMDVQTALSRCGYYHGVIDGDIGPASRAAIRAYQRDHGLPITGRIDDPLLRSLRV